MNRTLAESAPAQPTVTHLALWLMLTALAVVLLMVYLALARWLRRSTLRPLDRRGSPDHPPIDPWSESARRLDTDDPESD